PCPVPPRPATCSTWNIAPQRPHRHLRQPRRERAQTSRRSRHASKLHHGGFRPAPAARPPPLLLVAGLELAPSPAHLPARQRRRKIVPPSRPRVHPRGFQPPARLPTPSRRLLASPPSASVRLRGIDPPCPRPGLARPRPLRCPQPRRCRPLRLRSRTDSPPHPRRRGFCPAAQPRTLAPPRPRPRSRRHGRLRRRIPPRLGHPRSSPGNLGPSPSPLLTHLQSPHPLWSLLGVLFFALNLAAGLIWVERRLLALWQDRYGPNRVGPFGLLQVLADMIKIFSKEDWIPPFADRWPFVFAPAVVVATVLLAFAVVPFASGIVVADLNIGLLFFLAMSSLGVYSVVIGGWSSANKYALLGSLRAAAQMLSYEVFMGLAVMGTVILAGSFSLGAIVEAQARTIWFIVPQFLGFILFLIAGIAETRRLPLALPEAESELVAGFHSEYSGMKFGMFFVGEYLGVTLISCLITVLFLGGWLGPGLPGLIWFLIKMMGFICFFILLRAALPRPRFDQLMAWGWKLMLPLSLANLLVTGAIVLAVR